MSNSQSDIKKAIEKYELMEKEGRIEFFDLSTFEDIIEHYFINFKIPQALNVCENAHQVYPFSTSILVLKARILAYSGQFKEAFTAINNAEKIAPTDFQVLFHKGNLHSILGETDLAIASFEQALPVAENPADVFYNIGITLQSINDFEKATLAYKKAIESDITHEDAIYELIDCGNQTNKLLDINNFLQEFIDNDPYSADAWYNMGIFYSQTKNYSKALAALEYATLVNDKFDLAYMQMGHCFMNLKQYPESFRMYLEALQYTESPTAELYCHLGASAELMDDYNVGIRYFKKAIEVDEHYDEAWFGVGENHRKLGNFLQATHYLNKAVKLNKFYDEYWYSLARAECQLGNIASGLEAFKEGSEINPKNVNLWLDWSEVYNSENDLTEASNIILEGLNHLPENHSLHYRLSAYLLLRGKLKDAYKHIEKGLKLNYDAHQELVDFIPNSTVKKILETAIQKFK
ncbi:tetratricopeptide repeat protein [Flammeovirga kamogawensis]|uniref:Tetratricopeptide repeat protein n=1 Tax=Flammeovirga kamogawensis TaxID=373891 RepID=A0ABX8GRL5_9BACT|nr:tetratricopeptide repeat protein [Flammeovirga kamogawensis]MBB6463722.1 tetratricopeptide (TPR) repeat protein [Flammeovirga kamogawensis]QWG06220.1 tetratricopeptide repeat protein [Flammeovirga kamogawensis]TRX68051.1 tetratricopeptide repeat protein [Flammeovirga kamogawensis]